MSTLSRSELLHLLHQGVNGLVPGESDLASTIVPLIPV